MTPFLTDEFLTDDYFNQRWCNPVRPFDVKRWHPAIIRSFKFRWSLTVNRNVICVECTRVEECSHVHYSEIHIASVFCGSYSVVSFYDPVSRLGLEWDENARCKLLTSILFRRCRCPNGARQRQEECHGAISWTVGSTAASDVIAARASTGQLYVTSSLWAELHAAKGNVIFRPCCLGIQIRTLKKKHRQHVCRRSANVTSKRKRM